MAFVLGTLVSAPNLYGLQFESFQKTALIQVRIEIQGLEFQDPVHLPEKHLPEWTFPRKTLGRMDISPKTHFPESTLARMYIWPNGHFPECTFSRMDTWQKVQLMLAIIIQDDEIKLFCSMSRVNICFI